MMHDTKPHTYISFSGLVSCVVLTWCLAFVMTRLHMFQHAYATKWQEYSNDKWLREQCDESDFYHNMKHHSNICEDVNAKTLESIWLNAADHVARNSYLCGYSSCATLLEELVGWILGRGVIITSLVAGVLMVMPTILLPFFRRRYTHERFAYAGALVEAPHIRSMHKSDYM